MSYLGITYYTLGPRARTLPTNLAPFDPLPTFSGLSTPSLQSSYSPLLIILSYQLHVGRLVCPFYRPPLYQSSAVTIAPLLLAISVYFDTTSPSHLSFNSRHRLHSLYLILSRYNVLCNCYSSNLSLCIFLNSSQ